MAEEGRIVVMTGGNRGIGREVARQCAVRGDTVVLGSRDLAAGRLVAKEIGYGVLAVPLDVTDPAGLAAVADDVAHTLGRVDALVNNAAIHYDTDQTAVDVDLAVVRAALETNVLGAWQATLAFLPLLRASPHPRIVMVSSEGGSLASMGGGTPAYSVSKAGLNALTRVLAGDLRREGVLVNAVCPGWPATDMGGAGGRPVAAGARSVLWAVDLLDGGPTGTFTRDGQPLRW